MSRNLIFQRKFMHQIFACWTFLLPLISCAPELRKCPFSGQNVPNTVTIPKQITNSIVKNKALNFSVEEKSLNCKTWSSRTFEIEEASNRNITFFEDGEIGIRIELFEYFNPDEYCLSRFDDSIITISYCNVHCGKTHVCVPKCCGLGKVVNFFSFSLSCVEPSNDKKWEPTIYSKSENGKATTTLRQHIVVNHNPCLNQPDPDAQTLPYTYKPFIIYEEDGKVEEFFEGNPFQLLENGYLALNKKDNMTHGLSKFQHFCIDGMLDYEKGTENVPNYDFSGDEINQFVKVCDFDKVETLPGVKPALLIGFMMLGILFLLLTVVVYLLIWDKHNIHGWTVFAFVCAMLAFFIVLATSHIASTYIYHQNDSGSFKCQFIAVLCHLTFLCSFLWMFIINLDLFITFRDLAPSREKTKSIQRFCFYAAFAMGVPFVIVFISVILDWSYAGYADHEVPIILPKYGHEYCRIHPTAESYYLYAPLGILLGFNVIFFSSTVFTLWRYKQKSQNAANCSSNSSAGSNKQSLLLFCKLFVVMGITWVMELVSWYCTRNEINQNANNEWTLWDLFDAINLLQAVAIFFIFAAKRENLLWIYRKYPLSKKFIGPILRLKPCHVGTMDVEQTEMTSADNRKRIDRNTRVSFKSRISSSSEHAYD